MAGHMTVAGASLSPRTDARLRWEDASILEKHDDLDEEQIYHLRQHFEFADQNGHGAITFSELSRLLQYLGAGRKYGKPLGLGVRWLSSFGFQNTETINFQQFLEVVLMHNEKEDLLRALEEGADDYDLDPDLVEAAANDSAPSQAVPVPPNGLVDAAIEEMQDNDGKVDTQDQDPKNGPYPLPSLLQAPVRTSTSNSTSISTPNICPSGPQCA
jgi:Ca2+-binding EF-hand superfamily protein